MFTDAYRRDDVKLWLTGCGPDITFKINVVFLMIHFSLFKRFIYFLCFIVIKYEFMIYKSLCPHNMHVVFDTTVLHSTTADTTLPQGDFTGGVSIIYQ